MAVLHESADLVGGVDDLIRVVRRSQGCDHAGFGHRHVDHAVLGQRMSAGEQALWIDVGDRAGSRDVEIAAYQHRAHG